MDKILIEIVENEENSIDISISKNGKEVDYGKLGLGKILEEVYFIDEGIDSDVFRVGNKVLKIYSKKKGRRTVPSLECLQRYQELTNETKILLEENTPDEFKKFQGLNVNYNVVPMEQVYGKIGNNIREMVSTYFITGWNTFREVMEGRPVTASVQEFIPGEDMLHQIRKIEDAGIDYVKLQSFLNNMSDNLVKYGLIYFAFEDPNYRINNIKKDSFDVIITDLATSIWEQVTHFERGKVYASKIEVDKTVEANIIFG